MSDWQDMIVGDRMTVDQEFNDRVRDSGFSQQEWGLIMTAVELEIEGVEDEARLVADTSKVEQILPEIKRMNEEMPAMAGGSRSSSSGGLFDSIKSSLGLSGGVDDETLQSATSLADEYAASLQSHLESNGKWERIRTHASE